MAVQQVIKSVAVDVPVQVNTFEKFTVYVPTGTTGTITVQLDYGDGLWSAGTSITAGSVVTISDLAANARVHGMTGGGTAIIRGLYSHEGG